MVLSTEAAAPFPLTFGGDGLIAIVVVVVFPAPFWDMLAATAGAATEDDAEDGRAPVETTPLTPRVGAAPLEIEETPETTPDVTPLLPTTPEAKTAPLSKDDPPPLRGAEG